VLQVRIWFHCLRLLKVNRCGTQAAALSYHSIFGLVPLAIVTLMVFQMFPAFDNVSEKVKTFAYDTLNLDEIQYPDKDTVADESVDKTEMPKVSAADKLEELSEKFISKASGGAITIVGLALVIWAAIALLTTIEKTFNTIFHVGAGRSFLHRLFNYWALLTLGPILLALGIYVSGQLVKNKLYQKFVPKTQQLQIETRDDRAVADVTADPNIAEEQAVLAQQSGSGAFASKVGWLAAKTVPFLISLIAIFFLYFFLPNTRVSAKAALWGAFVAALIWSLAKFGFGQYVTKFVPQFAVYGVLGIIPLTVMWIYLSWLIVLFGLQLTYATQNVKRLDAAEFRKARRQEECFLANDQTVIRVMEYVLNAFERKDQKPVSVEAIAFRLGMPTDFAEKILDRMVQSGLLCHTSEPVVGYVPSTDGAHITLDEISRAIGEVSFAQPSAADATNMQAVFDELNKHMSRYTLKQVLNKDEDFQIQKESMPEFPDEADGVV